MINNYPSFSNSNINKFNIIIENVNSNSSLVKEKKEKKPRRRDKKEIESLQTYLNFPYVNGGHTIKSPVVGSRAIELTQVINRLQKEPFLAHLVDCFKDDGIHYILPNTHMKEAFNASKALFKKYISKYEVYGCTESNIVDWVDTKGFACINDAENGETTWRIYASIHKHGFITTPKDFKYLPPHILAYRAVMYIEETPIYSEESFDKLEARDLLINIKTAIILDKVYKQIHGLKTSVEVEYGKFINIHGNKINLGKFANFYRELEKDKKSLVKALLSNRSMYFLQNGKKYIPLPPCIKAKDLLFTLTPEIFELIKIAEELSPFEEKLLSANVTDNYYD